MVNSFTSTILITSNKGLIVRSITSLIAAMTLMMLFSVSAFAAQINVSVDRNPIAMTDSFQLTFSTTTSPDDDPNFAPLQKDFDIINQQKNSQLSWVNGSSNRSIQWTLNVMAKRSGELQIPAISFGDDASQPLSITVTKTTPSSAVSNSDELFLEVEATPTDNYVQAQILYTVRFYHRINLTQATLSDPELDNAVVEKIAEDTQYNTQIKGMTYSVTERKYAIFPQKSGAMTIAPLVLTAEVIIDDPRSRYNNFFTQHNNTQTKRVLSKEINLNIKAAPVSLKGQHWLPAEQVTLKEAWSNKTSQVKVGEPITRTLTISAKGATSSQLPDLSTQILNSELKIYPDQPIINDQQNGEGVMAMREQKIAFIPSTAGNFTLPAIEVPWFNTQTQEMETAQLPAVTLVAEAAASTNPTINNNSSSTTPAKSLTKDTEIMPVSKSDNTWMWASIVFGLAWLLTLLALFWSRFAKPRTEKIKLKTTAKNKPLTLKEVIKELKTACVKNDPQAAQHALIKWATLSYNITSLAELSLYCDANMLAELTKLNHALYAKEKLAWPGENLLKAVMEQQTKKSSIKKADEPLVPLYPSQR